ncbi:hypothetical protein L484_012488 [Morus notabilis]|uniref:Uncharacterized protein n=1 Tax=Morus notabilis TaxID=981085 RepID=W9R0U9_9ROSA|nr:uncharacterized protein LOC21395700 [Morus notabilis]EXB32760.1 hypothetical protein L484_012488 [Morus notabilis]
MAALSARSCFYGKTNLNIRKFPERSSPRTLVIVSCQSQEPIDEVTDKLRTKEEIKPKEQKEGNKQSLPYFLGFEELGKSLRENLSPKQKGDWKDVTLMSISFAVYVYMSQQIVCAYFAWMSIPRQQW